MTIAISPSSWSSLCNKLLDPPREEPEWDQVDPKLQSEIKRIWPTTKGFPLLLYGEAGSGKTCAAMTVWGFKGGWYGELKDLCNLYRRAQAGELYAGSDKVGMDYLLGHWGQVPVAVIDEIGMRNPTDFQYEVLKALLDRRKDNRLIVCSNLDPDELGKIYDDRIMSRLCCGTQFQLTGDRRMG